MSMQARVGESTYLTGIGAHGVRQVLSGVRLGHRTKDRGACIDITIGMVRQRISFDSTLYTLC